MQNLQIIEQRELLGQDFKIYGDFENPLFLAKDVAEWIDYSKRTDGSYQVGQMLKTIDDDEKISTVNNLNGGREMWFLTEDGLYEVLMQSRKPIAKQFKKEVKKILKTIRQTGGYIPIQEDDTEQEVLAKAFLIAQKTIELQKERLTVLETENIEMKPKAEYFDDLVDRNLLTNFRDTAKEFRMQQNNFMKFLIDNKYIYKDSKKNNKPYAQYVDKGLFEIKEFSNNGFASTQTLITPKGRETFRLLLKI